MTHMTALVRPRKGDAAKLRRARKRAADVRFLAACVMVRERDGERCRVCHAWGVEVHHIKYRSRGGTHETSNLICLCTSCHAAEHAHRIAIQCDGNGRIVVVTAGPHSPRRTQAKVVSKMSKNLGQTGAKV